MKAVVVTRLGGPEVLEVRDVPDPSAKPGEVIVRVEAVGVNFADTMSTRGSYTAARPRHRLSQAASLPVLWRARRSASWATSNMALPRRRSLSRAR